MIQELLTDKRCFLMSKSSLYIVDFNVTSSLSYSFPVSVTSHAVEKGVDISDHTKAGLSTIKISGLLSDVVPPWASNLLNLVGFSNKYKTETKDRIDLLNEWRSKGELLDFYEYKSTAESQFFKTFEGDDAVSQSYVISSFDYSKSPSTGKDVTINLTLQNIMIAEFKKVSTVVKEQKKTGAKKTDTKNKNTTAKGQKEVNEPKAKSKFSKMFNKEPSFSDGGEGSF